MAQDSGTLDLTADELADLGESATAIKDLRPQKDKEVFLIFDVSGSMKGFKMWNRARTAAANILRYGCHVGDEVGLLMFGADYTSYIQKIDSGDDKAAILAKLPKDVSGEEGTNIRTPHHEALKDIAKRPGRPTYIIIFTDSYNDEPKPDTPAYQNYLKYYTPGGMLTKYPKTPENRDYERLLKELVVSGKVKQYGIGINFAPDGRPIERLPQAVPSPLPTPSSTPDTHQTVPKPDENTSPLLWIILGAVGVVAVGGLVTFLAMPKPMGLRITNGPKEFKDFQVKSGQPVRIGGEGARLAPDAFPITELKAPVAVIRAGRGGLVIGPPLAPKGSGKSDTPAPTTSNENVKLRVLLNGLPLETETPMGYGDELRIVITPAGGVAKDYRLKLNDPKRI
jgi:hypothetical protein